jgi:hypothetical protein
MMKPGGKNMPGDGVMPQNPVLLSNQGGRGTCGRASVVVAGYKEAAVTLRQHHLEVLSYVV